MLQMLLVLRTVAGISGNDDWRRRRWNAVRQLLHFNHGLRDCAQGMMELVTIVLMGGMVGMMMYVVVAAVVVGGALSRRWIGRRAALAAQCGRSGLGVRVWIAKRGKPNARRR